MHALRGHALLQLLAPGRPPKDVELSRAVNFLCEPWGERDAGAAEALLGSIPTVRAPASV